MIDLQPGGDTCMCENESPPNRLNGMVERRSLLCLAEHTCTCGSQNSDYIQLLFLLGAKILPLPVYSHVQ